MQILLQTLGVLLQTDNTLLCILLILAWEVSIFVILQWQVWQKLSAQYPVSFLTQNKRLIFSYGNKWSKATRYKDYISQSPLHHGQAIRFRPMEWKQNCDFQERSLKRRDGGACLWSVAFLLLAGDKILLNWAPWSWKTGTVKKSLHPVCTARLSLTDTSLSF